MPDRARLILAQVYLTDEAAERTTTTDGFVRRAVADGKHGIKSMLLSFGLRDRKPILRLRAIRTNVGGWLADKIDVNLPSCVHGHNGRPLRNNEEPALALTRVYHFASRVVRPDCLSRIIPGLDGSNCGHIRTFECAVQFQDPDHDFPIGSHLAHRRSQHRNPLVMWGVSSRFFTQQCDLSIYDKNAEMCRKGLVHPAGIPSTRVELVVKNRERLDREAAASRIFDGNPRPRLRTLSFPTAYAMVRRVVRGLSGFGRVSDPGLLALSSTSRQLIVGLGDRTRAPHAVDQLLERYERSCRPGRTTLKKVSKEVRGYLFATGVLHADILLPENPDDIQWSEVHRPDLEERYQTLLRDTGAPMEPDARILEAWSSTTFLPSAPSGAELVGATAPANATPWKTTL